MIHSSTCPLIEVQGSPRERGRAYGEQARSRIALGVEHYTSQIQANGLTKDALSSILARYKATIEAYGGQYIEEMAGIAEGAHVDLDAIVLLNARTEVLKMARRRKRGEGDFIEPDGCTGVVVLPEASETGELIHAQNWDWKAECAETAVVLKIRNEDGPDILTFTEAGALARTGFNGAGITISGNYLESDRDYRQAGVPLAVIRRKVLEQPFLAKAMQAVYATAKSASNNMMIGQSGGIALDFECAPDETFLVHPDHGLLVHANHFQSAVALAKLVDKGIGNMPDSLYRDTRVRELLARRRGAINVDDVKAALFDDYQSPWSVCRPQRPSLTNNQSATVAMIVMQPARGLMEVALLPAHNRSFETYRLDTAPAEAAALSAA